MKKRTRMIVCGIIVGCLLCATIGYLSWCHFGYWPVPRIWVKSEVERHLGETGEDAQIYPVRWVCSWGKSI